jgi:hypothetical protein
MRRLMTVAALFCALAPAALAQSGADATKSPSGDISVRFVGQQKLPDGRVVVVAEGDGEPRSIGSYSVSLYGGANPDYPLDDFIVGTVIPRNGTVERLAVGDVNGDDVEDLVVVVRSAGSGGYLSATAIRFDAKHVEVIVTGSLSSDANPVAELRKAIP